MISTGFSELDNVIGGFESPELIIVGGISSIGKCSFLTSLVKKISIDRKIPSTFFNFRSNNKLLFNRFLSNITSINRKNFISQSFSEAELMKIFSSTSDLETSPIHFEEKLLENTIHGLRARIIFSIEHKQSKVIVIDNIQTLHTLIYNNDITIDQTIRDLKSISKELNIIIICSSNITDKNVHNAINKRPKLLDFDYKSQIEETADLIILIHRPEHYKIPVWDNDEEGYESSTQNEAELIIAKNRVGGNEANVRISFIGEFSRFDNLNIYEDLPKESNFEKLKPKFQTSSFELISNFPTKDDEDDFPF